MQTFEWIDATSVEHAAQLLANPAGTTLLKAGGIDLLDLMKEGILAPQRLINLKTISGLNRITAGQTGGLHIGALVTLAAIASDPQIREQYPALSEAAGHAATPQVRNAGTLGGNLLQKPRCWYYRNHHFHQDEWAGDALTSYIGSSGENQFHAIFDAGITSLVQSSTLATALTAYDASVDLVSEAGSLRTVPLREFFIPANFLTGTCTVIRPGEVLTRVSLPPMDPGTRAAYHKQTERDSYDWPICDVAVVLTMDAATVRSAAIVMGWVAPVPRRASAAESLLSGRTIDKDLAAEAARAAVADASPLSKNGYKVPILETVVRRTILEASQ